MAAAPHLRAAAGKQTADSKQLAAVNWAIVDQELDHIDPDFKDPKFYALKHVVDILSSSDPQGLVTELRQQEDRLMGLVDKMVQGYHSGFAKSIQNYSQILHLFGDAKEQVESLKKALADASRQLSAQSRHLQQQWRKGMSLEASLKLLDDIQSVVDAPARIEEALAAKDWSAAVHLLLEGCAKLAREELLKVGALRKLRGEMLVICSNITTQIMEELQDRVYSHAGASSSNSYSSSMLETARVGASATAAAAVLQEEGVSYHRTASLHNASPSAAGRRPASAVMGRVASAPALHRRAASSMPAFLVEALAESQGQSGPGRLASMHDLVACLLQLDALDEAKAFINLHTRREIRKLMLAAVEQWVQAMLQRGTPTNLAGNPALSSGGRAVHGVPAHVSASTSKLLQAVFERCLTALANLGLLLHEMANAPAGKDSAGLRLLRQQQQQQQAPVLPSLATTSNTSSGSGIMHEGSFADRWRGQAAAAYIQAEYLHAWQEMQEECQLLLSELLHVPLRGLQAVGTHNRTPGWLQDLTQLGEKALGISSSSTGSSSVAGSSGAGGASLPQDASRLTFSFEVTVQGLDSAASQAAGGSSSGVAADGTPASKQDGSSYTALLSKVLGGHPGSPYLTPAVHGPVTSFVDAALSIMERSQAGSVGAVSVPQAADGGREGTWLRQSMDDFVINTFLPQVWVDLRGRCTAALDDPEAFRPQIGLSTAALGSTRARSQRPVVPAARFTEQVTEDVMAWVSAMPAFSSSTLTGVVNTILGRVLEAFFLVVLQCLDSCCAGRLMLQPDLGLIMATEPDAVLLEDAMAFYVPRNQESFDGAAFVAALKSPDKPVLVPGVHRPALKVRGLGLEGEPAAEEVLAVCFRERPDDVQQLLSGASTQRLVQLAALSESLDHSADAILRLAGLQGGLSATDKRRRGGVVGVAAAVVRSTRLAGGLGSTAPTAPNAAITDMLAHMVDRYRSLAGACVRALRLDMLLLVSYHLHQLASASHMCEEEDVREVHPCIGALTRCATRAAEDTAPYLTPKKAAYIFSCVAPAVARYMMWTLRDVAQINNAGVERMIRTLAVAQGPLLGLGTMDAAGAAQDASAAIAAGRLAGKAVAVAAFDKAKAYYTLVGVPAGEVVRLAAEKPLRFSVAEWFALLEVDFPGRYVDESTLAALTRALDKAYKLSTGEKVVEALNDIRQSVQTPVVSLTGTITAGLAHGMLQAKALLKQAAASTKAGTSKGEGRSTDDTQHSND